MSWPSIRLPIPSWNFPRGNVSFAGLVQNPCRKGTPLERRKKGRKEGREKRKGEKKEKQRWSASDTAWLSIGRHTRGGGRGETYWSVASCTSSDEGVSRTDDGGEEIARKKGGIVSLYRRSLWDVPATRHDSFSGIMATRADATRFPPPPFSLLPYPRSSRVGEKFNSCEQSWLSCFDNLSLRRIRKYSCFEKLIITNKYYLTSWFIRYFN